MAGLDLDALLREITAEAPCGDNLEDHLDFMAVMGKAQGTAESGIGEHHVDPAQPPDWKALRQDLLKLLGKTRDLRLLAELARASLALDGVAGLAEALNLFKRALEAYWDTVHPPLDPDDGDDPALLRVNAVNKLADNGALFSLLFLLQTTPLVESRGFGRFSLRDVQIATGKIVPAKPEDAVDLALVSAVFNEAADAANPNPKIAQQAQATRDSLLAKRQALENCLESVDQIVAVATDKAGVRSAPNLGKLQAKLKECLDVFSGQPSQGGASVEPGLETTQGMSPQSPQTLPAIPAGGISSRADVVRALDLICEYYAKFEPSSPVPLLAQRAKRLVGKGFMEIMEDIASDGMGQVRAIKGKDPDHQQ